MALQERCPLHNSYTLATPPCRTSCWDRPESRPVRAKSSRQIVGSRAKLYVSPKTQLESRFQKHLMDFCLLQRTLPALLGSKPVTAGNHKLEVN